MPLPYNLYMKCIIVDYGTGNIQSVQNALERLGHTAIRSRESTIINTADVVIFPGQGAFDPAMARLKAFDLVDTLKKIVTEGRPFIGICLGFQLLFNGSDEAPHTNGLGCFNGHFNHFPSSSLSVPHMGWNSLSAKNTGTILDAFNMAPVYFVHSYYLPISTIIPGHATTTYGTSFVSAIANDTQLITQFHPEKSGDVGLDLLATFLRGIS